MKRWTTPEPTAANPHPKPRRVKRGRKRGTPEADLQTLCEQYLETVGLPYLHIPAEAYNVCAWKPNATGAEIAAMARMADYCGGFPDLAIFLPGNLAHVGIPPLAHSCLLVELKSATGKQNAAQKRWARQLTVHLVRTFEDFRVLVDSFRGV